MEPLILSTNGFCHGERRCGKDLLDPETVDATIEVRALRACSDARDHNTTIFSSPKGEGFRPSPEETLIRNSGCSVWGQ